MSKRTARAVVATVVLLASTAVGAAAASTSSTSDNTSGVESRLRPPPTPPAVMPTPDDNTRFIETWDANSKLIVEASYKKPVIIVFGNYKCGGCKSFRALLEKMVTERSDFIGSYADTTGARKFAEEHKIIAAPQTILLYKGQETWNVISWPGEKTGREWVNRELAKVLNPTPAPTPTSTPTTPPPAPTRPAALGD